jgi:hypothetical protein
MKLHANARTCPNSRKLLVKRIEEENWSLMAGRFRISFGSSTVAVTYEQGFASEG